MKLILTSATILNCFYLISGNPTTDFVWQAWKSKNRVSFRNFREESAKYGVFVESRNFVNLHNERAAKGLESYTVELNKFATMTEEEFSRKYLTLKRKVGEKGSFMEYPCPEFVSDGTAASDAISFRPGNSDVRVTSVKDQGQCGSCWTFGASAAIEATLCQNGLKDCNTWTGLAAQEMVDCASWTHRSTDPNVIDLSPYDNMGCSGGLQNNAIHYVELNNGQMNWDDYPYVSGNTGSQGPCAYDKTKANLNLSKGCIGITSGDEENQKAALFQKGPMTVSIDASGDGFRFYSSGVYISNTCSSTYLNHAVTATGYGVLDTEPYWEVKNSWAEDWGNKGYILMARNHGNMCGIAADSALNVM